MMQDLFLRKVTAEDAKMLLEWRNEASVRMNSFHSEIIEYADHIRWLTFKLADENEKFRILMKQDEPIGQIRLSRENEIVEISYSIDIRYRGCGYGKEIIRLAEEELRKDNYRGMLVGLVKKENKASGRVFLSLGYQESETEEYYRYEKNVNPMLYFRVDMNPVIATGHMMRCLSIADEVCAMGGDVTFITADEYPIELLTARGYKAIVLNTDWKDMDQEVPVLSDVIQNYGITQLLVDSYQVTKQYLEQIRDKVSLVYMDDLDCFEYPVDRIICYAGYWERFSYGKKKIEGQDYCLGMRYAPLRKAFQNCKEKEIGSQIKKILLLSGGSDAYHIIERMVEQFKDEEDVQFITICGRYYEGFEALKERYHSYSNLHFYKDISNLEDYMHEADLAISAGGTTLYELCAVGTPTISYSFADNQIYNVEQFAADNLIDYAGDVRKEDIFTKVKELYHSYNQDVELRKARSKRMQEMVDGQGAKRIAEVLLHTI